MPSAHHQVLKNCGNFSKEVLPGMIAYGRESSQENGRGHINSSGDLPHGDGYASSEGDLFLGGFVQRRAAQQAVAKGRHLSEMTLEERQKLALEICNDHIREFGPCGPEFYKHWMKRAENFAHRVGIALPVRGGSEKSFDYFNRVRQWTKSRDGSHPFQGGTALNWPRLRKAAGTHLVFSADPKIWPELRAMGMDERKFLQNVLRQTMKEVADWRRKIHGPGRSLGWVAGTHVKKKGAENHPHLHVFVLKRDEVGKGVDWSVSALKGRKGRDEPDMLLEAKRLFKKSVEREYQRATGKNLPPLSPEFSQQKEEQADPKPGQKIPHGIPPVTPFRVENQRLRLPNRLERLAYGLRAVARAFRPYIRRSASRQIGAEIGAMIRITRQIQEGLGSLPCFETMRQKIAAFTQQIQPEPEI